MNVLIVVTVCIVSLLLTLNSYISFLVMKSDFYEPAQKYAQYALIWLLPVIGAIACYLFVQPTLGTSSKHTVDDHEDVAFVSGDDAYLGSQHHD